MRLFYEELGGPWWHHLSSLLFSQPIQCYHRWPHRVRKEPQRLSPWIGSKFLSVFLTLLACIVSAGAWVRDLSVCPGRTLSESNGFSLFVWLLLCYIVPFGSLCSAVEAAPSVILHLCQQMGSESDVQGTLFSSVVGIAHEAALGDSVWKVVWFKARGCQELAQT